MKWNCILPVLVCLVLAGPAVSAAPPSIAICTDVTLEGGDILVDFDQDSGIATTDVKLTTPGSTETGVAATIDFDKKDVQFIGGSTLNYSQGKDCVVPAGDSASCAKCDPRYRNENGEDVYECNDEAGCSFTMGNLPGSMSDGQEMVVLIQEGAIVFGRIHIQN